MKVVLSIGGSDSSGGAGVQADIKTFSELGVFATSAITCVTAQNPGGVAGVMDMPAEFVALQIETVCDSFPVTVAKTGMLHSAEIIRVVANEDVREGIELLVVDPVMVASSGARLLRADAVEVLCNELLPQARVVTPNLHEAEILCGHAISSAEELRQAAAEIGERYDIACVAKGGHLPGDEVVDILYDEGQEYIFTAPRLNAVETHGAGCAFSAALTAFLAHGELMERAVAMAKEYVYLCLEHAFLVGRHHPLNFACSQMMKWRQQHHAGA